MTSALGKIAAVAALCFALVAATKLIRVEIYVYDPDDNAYHNDVTVSGTAYASDGTPIFDFGPETASGPNTHVRFEVPANADHLSVTVFDDDDQCTQVFDDLDLTRSDNTNGKARVGGRGFFLGLTNCTQPAPAR